jgi:hypothetical protein
MHLLLVSGPDALTLTPRAKLWANEAIHDRLILEPSDTLVVTRNVTAVDQFAQDQAHNCGFHWAAWGDDGWRKSSRTEPTLWAPSDVPRPIDPLLGITAVMADHLCRGGSAEVLLLSAPWAPFADALLTLASRLGLWIDQRVCPHPLPLSRGRS